MVAFLWGYSSNSISGLGITEYKEFQFRKTLLKSGNGIPIAEVA